MEADVVAKGLRSLYENREVLFVIGPGVCITKAVVLPGSFVRVPFDDKTVIVSLPIPSTTWTLLSLWIKPAGLLSRYDPHMGYHPPLRSFGVCIYTPDRHIGYFTHNFRVKEEPFVHGGLNIKENTVVCVSINNIPNKITLGVRWADLSIGSVTFQGYKPEIKEIEWSKEGIVYEKSENANHTDPRTGDQSA